MATIEITQDELRIRLTTFEKVFGLLRDQTIPLSSIVDVRVEPVSMKALRGWRAPGLGVPRMSAIGTWRGRGRREFVRARRHEPAVALETTGLRYDRYVVCSPDAAAVADRIRAAMTSARGRESGGPTA